ESSSTPRDARENGSGTRRGRSLEPLGGAGALGLNYRASGDAKGGAGHCRKRRINESGIEQTAAAFDVTLKTPTSRQGTGGLLPTLKAGAYLRRNSGVFEETPRMRVASLRGFSFANGRAGLFPSPALGERP